MMSPFGDILLMSPIDDFFFLSPFGDNGIMSPSDDTRTQMSVSNVEELGAAIRRRRRQLALDQQSLAERVGVSRQWIVEIEAGKPRAEIGLLLRTMNVLGLQLEIISPGVETRHPAADPPAARRRRRGLDLDLDPDIDAVIERARGLRR